MAIGSRQRKRLTERFQQTTPKSYSRKSGTLTMMQLNKAQKAQIIRTAKKQGFTKTQDFDANRNQQRVAGQLKESGPVRSSEAAKVIQGPSSISEDPAGEHSNGSSFAMKAPVDRMDSRGMYADQHLYSSKGSEKSDMFL
mmetsp:Transcript_40375/g.46330  ORF Transcript_40375/g.46330 Transcript_40375/m.46330 type:complete len:140 (+) Transcript_40375:392-811(+)